MEFHTDLRHVSMGYIYHAINLVLHDLTRGGQQELADSENED